MTRNAGTSLRILIHRDEIVFTLIADDGLENSDQKGNPRDPLILVPRIIERRFTGIAGGRRSRQPQGQAGSNMVHTTPDVGSRCNARLPR